jgi:hypothetical protein
LLARLATHFLLFDLEILCWPWLQLDPVRLLRAHSVRGGVIAVWPPAATVRALDRALTLPILNAAYRVSSTAYPAHERAQLLTVALRAFVSAADAENKMKKTLTRIWLNPPAPAVGMIRWALEHSDLFPDRRVLHTGALLATMPFVSSVVAHPSDRCNRCG